MEEPQPLTESRNKTELDHGEGPSNSVLSCQTVKDDPEGVPSLKKH